LAAGTLVSYLPKQGFDAVHSMAGLSYAKQLTCCKRGLRLI